MNRATQTLRNVERARVKDMNVLIDNGRIVGYEVNLAVTFVMEEAQQGATASGGGAQESARSGEDEPDVASTTGQAPPQ